MKNIRYITAFLAVTLSSFIFFGCSGGGSGTDSITDKEPGDIYVKPIQTPSYDEYVKGQVSFNKGEYASAQSEFQKSYDLAANTGEKNRALSAVAWAMLKTGSEAGKTDSGSVISTLEKIPHSKDGNDNGLYDYRNKDLNDARVALAMSYISKAQTTQDFQDALDLIKRIDPVATGGNVYQENKFFTYSPFINHGVSNGQTHAIAAYLYYLTGNSSAALDHINYSVTIAPQDAKVQQIKATLSVLGLFR